MMMEAKRLLATPRKLLYLLAITRFAAWWKSNALMAAISFGCG